MPDPQRLITITDVDAAGARRPVLATADPSIVAAVERAIARVVTDHRRHRPDAREAGDPARLSTSPVETEPQTEPRGAP